MKTWTDSTGLIWSEKIPGRWTFDEATKLTHEQFKAFLGDAPDGKKWILPTKEDFERAEKEGIRKQFDDFNEYFFWSSSRVRDDDDYAWGLYGYDGGVYYFIRNDYYSVRCAGR